MTQCGHTDLMGHGAALLKPQEPDGCGRSDNTVANSVFTATTSDPIGTCQRILSISQYFSVKAKKSRNERGKGQDAVAEGTVAGSQQGEGRTVKMRPSEALARCRLTRVSQKRQRAFRRLPAPHQLRRERRVPCEGRSSGPQTGIGNESLSILGQACPSLTQTGPPAGTRPRGQAPPGGRRRGTAGPGRARSL